jgi:hypothetical protein
LRRGAAQTPCTAADLEWNGLRFNGEAMRKTNHGKAVRLLQLVLCFSSLQ